ncbi:ATP-binding protein [Kribbella pratensis]|uniref:ATPase family protein associated with various cellular activities (AAA) n=1 Tax=Kribbella pratensis TaxID=2512112 RepID=A0A4R8CM81_9ACTN|nr:ATP-binding protein [Kribbella pratensis]TDW77145.1 ATPase family protein associated with various cellular activities (AAA) [Kribbella pratensis]
MSDHLTGRAGLLTARIADRCSDDDLRNDLTGLSKDLTTESLQIDHNDRIARVVEAFGLTPFAVDLLIMVGLPDEHGLLTRWARLTHPARLPFVTPAAIADALGLDAAGRRHLRAEVDGGALRRTGLIAGDPAEPLPTRGLSLPPGLWSALRGVDTWPAPVDADLRTDTSSTVLKGLTDVLTARGPVLVAVTGSEDRPPQERAALVRHLVEQAGRCVVPIDVSDRPLERRDAQTWSLHALVHDAIPLVYGGTGDAPLPQHPGPVVVCPAAGERAPHDVRPLVTTRLESPGLAESVALWEALLPGSNGTAKNLAGLVRVDGLSARRAVADAHLVTRSRVPEPTHVLAGLRQRIDAELPYSVRLEKPTAGWQDLVLTPPQESLLQAITARVAGQATVLHDWGLGAIVHGGEGVRALLTGPPGTGKSLAARVIAAELELDLMVVDLGALMSKWLGETEKNLGAVFDAARQARAVLFFDEADAVFGRRTEISDAQSRWANLQTAYVLARMDRFDGLVLLATNLRTAIDDAFVRRLDVIVEFDEPDREQRLQLWQRHLPATAPLAGDLDLPALAALYDVTGALIRNAVLAAAFAAAAHRRPIDQAVLVQAVRHEYEKAGRSFPGTPRRAAGTRPQMRG